MTIKPTMKTINRAFAMKDSMKKLMRINELMLKVDYASPIWNKLDNESRRLQAKGILFPV